MSGLSVSVSPQDGAGTTCTVVRVAGEADATTPEMGDVLLAEAAKLPRLLLVEMSALIFMDSSALHALFRAHKELRAAGCALALVGPAGAVARLLRVTAADQVIPIYASTEEAFVSTAARDAV